MSTATKSSFVRMFVAFAGLVTALVNLLGGLLRLLGVLVTSLTSAVQRAASRAAARAAARAQAHARAVPAPFVVAPQPFRMAAPFMPYAPAMAAPFAAPAPLPPEGGRTPCRTQPMDEPPVFDASATDRMPQAPADAAPSRPAKTLPPAGAPFALPGVDQLAETPSGEAVGVAEDKLQATAVKIVETLAHYGVQGTVEEVLSGPTVTTYEVAPAAGTKVSKVAQLADDIALALARKVRIVAPIPGKNRIGFEMPNDHQVPVGLRDLVADPRFQAFDAPLPVVLGRDATGNPVYADLASMPHVIVAGATGSGKSVGLNAMLLSLLYRRSPEELRLLMIDPKVVELAPFNGIPHMLLPVVTDMNQAATALNWAVDEMERRYQLFAHAGTKNVASYNAWVERVARGETPRPLGVTVSKLPWIVIVVDEFADLMMQQGKDVETAVTRLAQKARASGMHIVLATQRPSVDVITGVIKANFPSRIAYRVSQRNDSRVILDESGAEQLLGCGDMLVKINGAGETRRVQGPWVSEEEVARVTSFLRAQGAPAYDSAILRPRDAEQPKALGAARRGGLRAVV